MRVQSLVTSVSKVKQAALGTAQTSAGNFLTFPQVNRQIPNITRNNRTNVGEIGGGLHPSADYLENAIFEHAPEYRLSTLAAAHFLAYAAGEAVKSTVGTEGAIQYVMTLDNDDVDTLPVMTFYAGLGQGASDEIMDQRFVGVAVDTVAVRFTNGTSIDNASLAVGLVGTGRVEPNANFTPPAVPTLNLVGPGSITTFSFDPIAAGPATINFLTNCPVLSGEFTLNNGIKREGNYRACDSQQYGYYVMGRMRRSVTALAFSAQVEVQTGSTEEDFFLNRTEGALDFKMEGAQIGAGPEKHTIRVQFPRCKIIIESKADADDLVVYNLRFEPLYDSTTSKICTITVICETDGILS